MECRLAVKVVWKIDGGGSENIETNIRFWWLEYFIGYRVEFIMVVFTH